MNELFTPPLSIYFVWYPSDDHIVKPIFEHCFSSLSRDVNKPFSRSMNLPIYCRTSTHKGIPNEIPILSEKTIVFIFISREFVVDDDWVKYIREIPNSDNTIVIPIALDKYAFKLNSIFEYTNYIRSEDFDKIFMNEYLFISITHEIYRCSLNENFEKMALGKDNALKLFLSHAKDGNRGILLAKALKNFIDNSTMRNFFDATDIAPGYRFTKEIIGHISDSTVIAIHTDAYSSRYWCQREILSAKELDRPIIAVDSLEEFEDRRFPFATNIPGVHINLEGEPKKDELLRILSVTLLETVRFFYAKLLLKQYKKVGIIEENAILLSRPPEVSDINKVLFTNESGLISHKHKHLVYPEPPVYTEEISFLSNLGVEIITPLTLDFCPLTNRNVGISISDPSFEEITSIGQTPAHLVHFAQDLARHLISRESILSYGGDLRENGFSEFIFNEVLAYQTRAQKEEVQINNYIAWPIHVNDIETTRNWKANYKPIAKMIELPPNKDVLQLIPSVETFLPPTNSQNLYVWSRNLTEMRELMAESCHVRVCAGGRLTGYKGSIPGVLEEIVITLKLKRPLFLVGGFGGVTASVCKSIQNKVIAKELTRDWQIENNAGYKEFLDFYSAHNKTSIEYEEIAEVILNADFNNGLTEEENNKLFNTPFIDEALYLVFKGLKKISL